MGTPTSVPFAVTLDDADSPHDAIDALIVERFVAGVHPCARTARLERVRKEASLLPPGVVASHTVGVRTAHVGARARAGLDDVVLEVEQRERRPDGRRRHG